MMFVTFYGLAAYNLAILGREDSLAGENGRHAFGLNQSFPGDAVIRQDNRIIGGFEPGETKIVSVTGFDPPFTEPGLNWVTFRIHCDRSPQFWDYISINVVDS